MAREKPTMDYGAMIRALRQEGPQRVYLLYGDEDYLRDSYLQELKKLCVDEDTEAFNYHRLPAPPLTRAHCGRAWRLCPSWASGPSPRSGTWI